jgi:glycosyltransferase involved in cell wall biosynthesis
MRAPVVQPVRLLRSSYIGPIHRVLSWIVARAATAVIAVSKAAAADFGACPRMTVIGDCLAGPPRHPPKAHREAVEDCAFVCIGNYVRGKGQDLALQAFAHVHRERPGATLAFVGRGEDGELDPRYVHELNSLRDRLGLESSVTLAGAVDDVEAAMKAADVVVNFSESESFSMVCLEALSFGLPLIATACGGPSELVEDGETGLLVAVGSEAAAAEAMLRLARSPARRAALGREAAARTPTAHSAAAAAANLAQVYDQACSR